MRRKIMPAMALAAITLLAVPAATYAQTPGSHRGAMDAGDPTARILELRQELGLTDAQVGQLGRIRAELREQNSPLLEQLSETRAQMRSQRQELTPEQREQRRTRGTAMRDSMRARRQQMTPEQRQQMRARMQQMTPEQREQMRARRQQMTPEQRQQMRDSMQARMRERRSELRQHPAFAGRPRMDVPEELRPVLEQLRTNAQNAMQQIRSTLTAEQQTKLRELRPARGQDGTGVRQPPRNRSRGQGAAAGTAE